MSGQRLLFITDPPNARREDMVGFIKILASSLLRTCFSGKIIAFIPKGTEIFRVGRTDFLSIYSQKEQISFRDYLDAEVDAHIEEGDWIIFCDATAIALRNIDHLIPERSKVGNFDCGLIYLRAKDGAPSASVWAIQNKYLIEFIDLYNEFHLENPGLGREDLFRKAINNITIKKKDFEKAQVIEHLPEIINWRNMQDGSISLFVGWDYESAWTLTQSVYYGKFLGDKSGMILGILDA